MEVLDQESGAGEVARLPDRADAGQQDRAEGRRELLVEQHDRAARRVLVAAIADRHVDIVVLQVTNLVGRVDPDVDLRMHLRKERQARHQHQRGK
jgi:hypothetical protein